MTLEELQKLDSAFYERHIALESRNESLEAEVDRLNLKLKALQHKLFGKSSERRADNDNQVNLFDLASPEQPEEKKVPIKAHTRHTRTLLPDEEAEAPEGTFPEHLRRVDAVIDEKPAGVAEEDLEVMSTKITERLAEVPGEYYVKRTIRRVYKQKSTGEIFQPPAPEHVFGRCKVDESFLVSLAIKKFLWHQPLHRQHQALKLEGIELNRAMFAEWLIKLALLFVPVAKALFQELLLQAYLHIDETPHRVGRGKQQKGKRYGTAYYWPVLHPDIGVAFIYRRGRSQNDCNAVLAGYEGTLINDAYSTYECYVAEHQNKWQLCWMHIRRNFLDCETSNPQRAEEALEFIRALYRVETEIKQQKLKEPERIAAHRLKHSEPILIEFKEWLKTTAATPEALTSDPLAAATAYALKRWDAATLFVRDGNLPPDNGEAERRIRPIKVGIKNYLFCASEAGAEAAATIYTLISSALMHGIHPYYYLLDLTKRIDQPGLTARDLIPHRWKQLFYNEAVPEHLRHPP